MTTKDLIAEAASLPVEDRAIVVDSLLKSLNLPETDIDRKWAEVAKRRLSELRSGSVEAVPGDEVFNRVWRKFSSWNSLFGGNRGHICLGSNESA